MPPLTPSSAVEAQQHSPGVICLPPTLPISTQLSPASHPFSLSFDHAATILISSTPDPSLTASSFHKSPPEPRPQPTHTMTTRAKNNIHKPVTKMNLHTQLSTCHNHKPATFTQALKNHN